MHLSALVLDAITLEKLRAWKDLRPGVWPGLWKNIQQFATFKKAISILTLQTFKHHEQ